MIERLIEDVARLRRELDEVKTAVPVPAIVERIGNILFVSQSFEGLDPKVLREVAEHWKTRISSGVVALTSVNDGKVAIVVAVTDNLAKVSGR